jgi:hypothetical protein
MANLGHQGLVTCVVGENWHSLFLDNFEHSGVLYSNMISSIFNMYIMYTQYDTCTYYGMQNARNTDY